jgi:hypothetical protein
MSFSCRRCGHDLVSQHVPQSLSSELNVSRSIGFCPRCFAIETVVDSSLKNTLPPPVKDALPTGKAAIGVLLLVHKLEHLAAERAHIEYLLKWSEDAGGDVLLTLDRLSTTRYINPPYDLDRRISQLRSIM